MPEALLSTIHTSTGVFQYYMGNGVIFKTQIVLVNSNNIISNAAVNIGPRHEEFDR